MHLPLRVRALAGLLVVASCSSAPKPTDHSSAGGCEPRARDGFGASPRRCLTAARRCAAAGAGWPGGRPRSASVQSRRHARGEDTRRALQDAPHRESAPVRAAAERDEQGHSRRAARREGAGGWPVRRAAGWSRDGDPLGASRQSRPAPRRSGTTSSPTRRTEMARAVAASTFASVIASFNVDAYGPDSAAVVDVTRLFTAPPSELGPGATLRGIPDATRSLIERVAAYPGERRGRGDADARRRRRRLTRRCRARSSRRAGSSPPSNSLVMHWSIVKLPERPMMARLADSRVGYFTTQQVDYGRPEQRAEQRHVHPPVSPREEGSERRDLGAGEADHLLRRSGDAELAQAVHRKGIEAWKPAFEAAGFRNAIVAKRRADAGRRIPTGRAEDARYSVVRWLPSDIANAQGPNVNDPRSGEILEADVYMYHNIMELQRIWYFTPGRAPRPARADVAVPGHAHGAARGVRGRARGRPHVRLPAQPEVVVHVSGRQRPQRVVGPPHGALGRRIMDYSRFNYAAQPEDKIPLADLIPGIGPYDRYATHWGYAPIPGARTPDDERTTLDGWAREQDATPWLRYNVVGIAGLGPRRSDGGRGRRRCGEGDGMGHQEHQADRAATFSRRPPASRATTSTTSTSCMAASSTSGRRSCCTSRRKSAARSRRRSTLGRTVTDSRRCRARGRRTP